MKEAVLPQQHEWVSRVKQPVLPAGFINAYEIINGSTMGWDVNVYKVRRTDTRLQDHNERGDVKNAIWSLRKKHKDRCRGYGFVIDIGRDMVAIPASWDIPSPENSGSFTVTREKQFSVSLLDTESTSQEIVAGIIREGLKNHFKNGFSEELGKLWQDKHRFCQVPKKTDESDYYISRRFGAAVKILRANKFVVQCSVGTAMLDNQTFADYYQSGEVARLAQFIKLKQAEKVDRQNQPVGVRVLRVVEVGGVKSITALELDNPDEILKHSGLGAERQKNLSTGTVFCRAFGREPEAVQLSELVLILDSQITQEDHAETIIEPSERVELMQKVRNFVNGAEIYGHELKLSTLPFDASSLVVSRILPPSIWVKGRNGSPEKIAAPAKFTVDALRDRVKARIESIRRNGFLEQRSINPLLAYPRYMKDAGARRMQSDLNYILESQQILFKFKYVLYDDVEEIRKAVEDGQHDALLAVLPDNRNNGEGDGTHDLIKQNIEVPSQCIQASNTLPSKWISSSPKELQQNAPKLGKKIRQRYELCIINLLVKYHWIPFAPAEPFNFNVHIGLDVGGSHNTDAVSCFGYGFQKPHHELLFRPDEIPIETGKAEPIPTNSLYAGLLKQFGTIRAELIDAGVTPDFEQVLFFRDGQLQGDGDKWNEKDALKRLHADLLKEKWISENSVWAAVEVMKYSEGWRLFTSFPEVDNPLAGICLQLSEDDSRFLVCTTGRQYLTQGTAYPLLVRITDIHGRADRLSVLRDLIWQADMCFTKPDTGMKLPWILHVADSGALQLSRSYKITGITA